MTDKDKLKALLKEFGVGFKDEGLIVKCEEGMEKVDGYTFFFTNFEFDAEGKFVAIGAWE